jgi:hypothetical protein
MEQEKRLIQKTNAVLNRAYHSIYQPYTVDKKDRIKRNELLSNPYKIHYYQDKSGLNYIFIRNRYQPEVGKVEIELGEKLIHQTQNNLNTIDLRYESLQKLRNTLLSLKKRHKIRKQLEEAITEAENLKDLHYHSMNQHGTIKIEQELLNELSEMQSAIEDVENSGKVELLQQYNSSLDSLMDENQSLMHEINRKLGL